MIDAKELLQRYTIEELNEAAEAYFAKVTDHTYLLTKPFATADECAKMMFQFSAVIQGLQLFPAMDIVDFGAGTCWASHLLTQFGLKVHATDVSPTALEIGRRRYELHPPMGTQPAPSFHAYDGYCLPFPDNSMHRVVCFDAFHHVPNPARLLAEMARVLKEDGVAGFSEPGPEHSKTDLSQQEMSNHAVLESDIVIEEIWDYAQAAGFKRIELAALSLEPVRLSLAEYDSFLHQSSPAKVNTRILESIRGYAHGGRIFFLHKQEVPELTSRTRMPLTGELTVNLIHDNPMRAEVTATNTSQITWLPSEELIGGVNLGCHLVNVNTKESNWDFFRSRLKPQAEKVLPGETVTFTVNLPPLAPGEYELEFDLVSEYVAWFADHGSKVSRFRFSVQG